MSNAFTRKNRDLLMYGVRPCLHNHVDQQGRTVRLKKSKSCWACVCILPDGPFDFDFGDLPKQEINNSIHKTKEEKIKARSDASARWSAKNKDKFSEYQKTYYSKPEIKEKRRERARIAYLKRTPEQKEKIRIRQLENYYKRKQLKEQDEHKGA